MKEKDFRIFCGKRLLSVISAECVFKEHNLVINVLLSSYHVSFHWVVL